MLNTYDSRGIINDIFWTFFFKSVEIYSAKAFLTIKIY